MLRVLVGLCVLRAIEIIYKFVCVCVLFLVDFLQSHAHTFCLGTQALPLNLKYLLLFDINLFSELSDAVPSFDAQQQARPFYD